MIHIIVRTIQDLMKANCLIPIIIPRLLIMITNLNHSEPTSKWIDWKEREKCMYIRGRKEACLHTTNFLIVGHMFGNAAYRMKSLWTERFT